MLGSKALTETPLLGNRSQHRQTHTEKGRWAGNSGAHFWKERKDKRIRKDKDEGHRRRRRRGGRRRRIRKDDLSTSKEQRSIQHLRGHRHFLSDFRFVYVATRRFAKPGFSSYSPSNSPLLSRFYRSNVNRSDGRTLPDSDKHFPRPRRPPLPLRSALDAQHHTRLRLDSDSPQFASTPTPFVHFWHRRRSRRASHSRTAFCFHPPGPSSKPSKRRPYSSSSSPTPPVSTLRPPLSSTRLRKLHPHSFPPSSPWSTTRARNNNNNNNQTSSRSFLESAPSICSLSAVIHGTIASRNTNNTDYNLLQANPQ